MDWFKSKGWLVIALVTIIGTLAGFCYSGATYVNRIENLEAKVVTITTTKLGLQEIEKRFETLDTSLEYINKSLDSKKKALKDIKNKKYKKKKVSKKEASDFLKNFSKGKK